MWPSPRMSLEELPFFIRALCKFGEKVNKVALWADEVQEIPVQVDELEKVPLP